MVKDRIVRAFLIEEQKIIKKVGLLDPILPLYCIAEERHAIAAETLSTGHFFCPDVNVGMAVHFSCWVVDFRA